MAALLKRAGTLTRQLLSSQCHKCSIIHRNLQSGSSLGFFHGPSRSVSPKIAVTNVTPICNNVLSSNFSSLASTFSGLKTSSAMSVSSQRHLLNAPPTPLIAQTRGFKMKGVLRKRCQHCQIKRRKGNVYVLCKENPRHKQKLIKEKGWVLPGTWVNKWY